MPIYAYKCATCGHALDVLQKLSDAPLAVCPACGAASFAKQVTAAGFQLKGSGWYVTDFRDNGKKGAAADKSADAAPVADTQAATTSPPAPGSAAEQSKPGTPPAAKTESGTVSAPAAKSPAPPPTAS